MPNGFTLQNISNVQTEQRLRETVQRPQPISLDTGDLFARRFGQEEQLVGLQAQQQLQQTLRGATQAEQAAKASVSQRGLGLTPFAQELMEPTLENIEFQKALSREQFKQTLPAFRVAKIDSIKNEIASKGLEQASRQFQVQQRQFNRDFSNYQQTTEAKFGKELRTAKREAEEKSRAAWENLALTMERKRRGGRIIGGLFGAGIGFLFGGPVGALGGLQVGRGLGGAFGSIGAARRF